MQTRAFTLIEVLLAVAITAVIAASVVGVLSTAQDATDHGRRVMNEGRRDRAAMELLGLAVRGMVPVTPTTADIALHIAKREGKEDLEDVKSTSVLGALVNVPQWFRGAEKRFGFTLDRPFSASEADGYLHWITLDCIKDDTTSMTNLVLTDTPFLRNVMHPEEREENDPPAWSMILIPNISAVTFFYELPRSAFDMRNSALGQMTNLQSAAQEWKYDEKMIRRSNTMPVAVRMSVTFPDGDTRSGYSIRYPFGLMHKPWLPDTSM